MSLKIGVDLGSTALKVVVIRDGKVIGHCAARTIPGQEKAARAMLSGMLAELGAGAAVTREIAATGYGKKLFHDAALTVDEITANALGAYRLSEGRARIVVNIGGQDMKAIHIGDGGRVTDFRMNDKCAAGAGRFFEQAARILDTPLEDFGGLAEAATDTAELNSTCVVFAESEMVSLLARDVPKENIIRGLCRAVARRAASFLGAAAATGGVYLDGGPAMNRFLAEALSEELLDEVGVLPDPQFTVAAGAAFSL